MLTHFKERRRRKRMASVRQRQMRRLRALAQWWPLESRWRWADCVNLTWEQLIHTSPTAHSHETPASFAQSLSKINHQQNDLLSFGPLHSNEMDEVCSVQLVVGGGGGGGGEGKASSSQMIPNKTNLTKMRQIWEIRNPFIEQISQQSLKIILNRRCFYLASTQNGTGDCHHFFWILFHPEKKTSEKSYFFFWHHWDHHFGDDLRRN